MISTVPTATYLNFDFFFILFAEAITCIVIGAIYRWSDCSNDLAIWLIVFGSIALALWFFEHLYVYNYLNGYYDGPLHFFIILLSLATLAIGIVTSVKAFRLGVPSNDTCNHKLHTAGFALMIIFCVISGLIIIQMFFSYRSNKVLLVRRNSSPSLPPTDKQYNSIV